MKNLMKTNLPSISIFHFEIFATACIGIALRSIISIHSYSGHSTLPMFGDYEAQRHWQEVTVNLELSDWYKNGTNNDLQYWGLDYPPLTAYHSYILGKVAKSLNNTYVELHKSRGFETKEHKSFMRLTVLLADIFIYIPGTLSICICLNEAVEQNKRLGLFLMFMVYPSQILIDNGHFQYNNISLGLAAIAIAAILRKKHCLATFAFTLALNYKQMELYHALSFFSYLLGECLTQKSFKKCAVKLTSISLVVILTFFVLWFPWLHSFSTTIEVLQRLFPVGRGVFEDKVANFWCALNVIFKFRKHLMNHQIALVCLGSTLAAALPANVALFSHRTKLQFLLSLFNTSASFYMFSFQVHEKTILLVALPACCLFNRWPKELLCFLQFSVFSMLPLLAKDKLIIPSLALMVLLHLIFNCEFFLLNKTNQRNEYKLNSVIYNISLLIMVAITTLSFTIAPPIKYPDLWPLIISVVCSMYFMLFLLWGNYSQIFHKSSKIK